jgi:hypothetical protein
MANPFETPQNKGDAQGNAPSGQLSDDARESLARQYSLSQQRKQLDRANPNPIDLIGEAGYSAIYSGLQSPAISLGQIADNAAHSRGYNTNFADKATLLAAPEVEQFGSARWHAQQVGGGLGMMIPFMAAKGGLKATGLSFAAKTEASALAGSKLFSLANAGLVADGATAGFAYDFLLRPVDKPDLDPSKFWRARTDHGLTGAATFATLTAGSVTLRHLSRPLAASIAEASKPVRIASDVVYGALPGAPAGIVNADVNARLTQGRWATNQERIESAYTMTFAGGALGGLHGIPGSNVPYAEVAKAYSSRRAGQTNLEAMLGERAKGVTESKVAGTTGDAKLTSTPVAESSLLSGRENGSSSRRLLLEPGRAMASGDVEKPAESGTKAPVPEKVVAGEKPATTTPVEKVAAPVEMEISVPKGLETALERGVNLAFEASDANCTPKQVADFFNFARSPEGQALKSSMAQVAKNYADDPRMMTLIREAYLPPEGIEHRVIEGDIKLKTPGATIDQYQRWAQFMQSVREMPQDVDGYINFRHDVFRWLNENKDLHDWARQYGEQNRYSKVAGPLDYYFGTSNLARFVDVADGKIAPNVAPRGSQTRAVVDAPAAPKPDIRLDLTAEQARRGAVQPDAFVGDFDIAAIAAGKLPPGARPIIDIEGIARTEAAPRTEGVLPETRVEGGRARIETERPEAARSIPENLTERAAMDQRMEAFERSPASRQKIEAMLLSEKFGDMTTEQFAKWLDYAYQKPAGATNDSATNLRSMWIGGRDALLNPVVAEAYKAYRGFGEAPAEGQAPPPSLELVRQFLSAPKTGEAPPLSEWANFYIDARLIQAQMSAKPDAKPNEVMDAALPRWFVEGLKAQYVTDAKFAGDSPTYSSKLPANIAEAMEAARLTTPPKKPRTDGRPEREYKAPTNDAAFRLTKLEEVLQVQDPVIRDNLLRLGAQDQTSLRNILQKLDPERAAPEYQELLRLVLPTTNNIADVRIMLDAIFFGNKNNRTDAGSELTKSHKQLAMAVAENLVPQESPNFERTQQIIADMINGKIRDPRPPRDFDGPGGGRPGGPGGQQGGPGGRNFGRDGARDGGREGGKDGRDGGRDAGRGNGDVSKSAVAGDKLTGPRQPGSSAAKVLAAPPRPPAETVVKDQPAPGRAETSGRAVVPEAAERPTPEAAERPTPEAIERPTPEAAERPTPETQRPAPETQTPLATEAVPPPVIASPEASTSTGTAPRTAAGGAPEAGTPVEAAAPPKEVRRDATEPGGKVAEATEATARDVSTLKNGQKVKVDGKDVVFVAPDAVTGEIVVRTGKPTQPQELFYNQKQFGKFKWHQVGRDNGTNRTIYRDNQGKFFEVRPHGSGFMTAERTEYRAVKPEQIK